jgi:hypothetical protein
MAGDDDFPEDLDDADLDEDALEEEELDEDALEEDVLDEDAEVGDDTEVGDEEDEDDGDRRVVPARAPTGEGEGEDDDDEDLVDPDDVEADLDTILKDRMVAADDDGDDDEEELEVDDRGDPVDRIQPKRPGEFVCQSCFLVKHPSQLADDRRMLCADCV